MPSLVRDSQSWQNVRVAGVTEFTVTLQRPDGDGVIVAPATAGATLVVTANGGARVLEVRTGGSSGPLFTRRAEALGNQSVTVHDLVAVGGETTLWMKLNGAENVAGSILELQGLGAFVAASVNDGTSPAAVSDYQITAGTATLATGRGALVASFSMPATGTGRPFNGINQWRGFGPLGQLVANEGMQPGANTEFVWATGLADVDAGSAYPAQLTAGQYRATSQWISGTDDAYAVQAIYAAADAELVIGTERSAVAAENSLPGTAQSNWFLGPNGTSATIAGYTHRRSYRPGDTVEFKVDSTGHPFRVEIYRLGYYGWETLGARHVLGNQAGYLTGTVSTQPAPTVDPTLGAAYCQWNTNASWTVPDTACPGIYYVVLRRTDDTAQAASTHFVLGSGDPTGRAAVVTAEQTFAAYNVWGLPGDHGDRGSGGTWSGRSFYQAGTDLATPNYAHRAYGVSFARPLSIQSTQANTYLFDSDYGQMMFAEAQGYDLDYYTDLDLADDPQLMTTAAAVLMLGHHEYWVPDTYDAFTNARDAGVNILITSSNTALWRCRFAAADTAHSMLICYKESGSLDISAGFDNGTGRDPVSYTGTWRDARSMNTDRRRENTLTGQMFVQSAPTNRPHKVSQAAAHYPIWRNSVDIQALSPGGTYTLPMNTMGDEVDCPDGSAGQPSNMVLLNPSSASFVNVANAAGTTYSGTGTYTVSFTLYRHDSSGALVFNTGAWRGWWGLTRWRSDGISAAASDPNLQNAYLAIMHDLGLPITNAREMRPGVETPLTSPSVNAPVGARDAIARAYLLTVPDTDTSSFFAFFD
jgi:N,N-dimethylformamidase beta subunit-like protein